jgi:hypothetical protein
VRERVRERLARLHCEGMAAVAQVAEHGCSSDKTRHDDEVASY